MFDRDFIKSFFHFCEEATTAEIEERLGKLQALKLQFATDADVYHDACFLERKLREELLSRTALPNRRSM